MSEEGHTDLRASSPVVKISASFQLFKTLTGTEMPAMSCQRYGAVSVYYSNLSSLLKCIIAVADNSKDLCPNGDKAARKIKRA